MATAHSVLGASGAKRWMSCPGSVALCATLPRISSSYANEGTAAHKLGEILLTQDVVCGLDYLGQTLEGEIVTAEMIGAVEIYVAAVKQTAAAHKGKIAVEQKLDLGWLVPGMFGTNDATVVAKKDVWVYDYKHGKGVVVEVEWNAQMLYYALGALFNLGRKTGQVHLVVVQPRAACDAVNTWTLSAEQVWAWGETVLKPAALRAQSENAPLSCGEHCRFCPALGVCPEKAKEGLALAKCEFGGTPSLQPVEQLSVKELAYVVKTLPTLVSWAKAAEAALLYKAETGEDVSEHGFKLVAKRSVRKWMEGAQMKLEGMFGEQAYEKSLISVAVAEKLAKATGNPFALLADVIDEPDNGCTLAPLEDRRSAVPPPARAEFLIDADFLE
jgi:hypothetical protein